MNLLTIPLRGGRETMVFLHDDGQVSCFTGTRDRERILGGSLGFACNVCGEPFREHTARTHCYLEGERWFRPEPAPVPEPAPEPGKVRQWLDAFRFGHVA